MSDTSPPPIETLVTPGADPARATQGLLRALDALALEGAPDLVALIVPVPHANATALRLLDRRGRPAAADVPEIARAISGPAQPVGLATVSPGDGRRAWRQYQGGEQVLELGLDDELYLPHDEDGFPDLSAEPVRAADGPPTDWRRLRTCLDLGMASLCSCRFTPVVRQFERLQAAAAAPEARAFALRWKGRRLRPPQEMPWQDLYRR